MTYRPLLTRYRKTDLHWVGDGFYTQGLLPYQQMAQATSPFLLAGYNPPRHFAPSQPAKGIGMHPHRGFETVTVVFQGGVAHADTMGNHGEIGPEGVQWMTAGRGVQHEEYHADHIARDGGTLEMVQLWVNLPQKDRMTAPRYQDIAAKDIPHRDLPLGGKLRVIAGQFEGLTGPTQTFSPLVMLDIRLKAGEEITTDLPEGWSQSVLHLEGRTEVNETLDLEGTESLIFDHSAGKVHLRATKDSHLMILGGQTLQEPLVMGGPFVAGSEAELRRAYADFRAGLF